MLGNNIGTYVTRVSAQVNDYAQIPWNLLMFHEDIKNG